MRKHKTVVGISVSMAAVAGIGLLAGLWVVPRAAQGAAQRSSPSSPAKLIRFDETANEYLDFETARLALIDCINSLDEPKLKEALPQLQAPPIRDPQLPPSPADTPIILKLRNFTINLRAKKWSASIYDNVSGNLSFSGDFYKDEKGQWKTLLRGIGWSGH